MSDFDVNMAKVDGLMALLEIDLKQRTLTDQEKAMLVYRFADRLEVPAIVYSPADLVEVSAGWADDVMDDAELELHRELAAKAYPLLPRLLEKAEPDYSVLEWALANAKAEWR